MSTPRGHEEEGRTRASTPLECSEALLRMFEYLDGEMDHTDASSVQEHLAECAECLRQYRLDEMVKVVVKRSCGRETAPLALRQTILHRLTIVRLDRREEVE